MTTASERLKGNTGLVLTLQDDALPAFAADGDVKACRITSEDKDDSDLTFAEAAEGDTKDYTVTVTAIQSTATGSFWRLLWEKPGTEFAVVYGPHGNAVPTEDKPHFLFTAKSDGRPEIGGEARRTKEGQEFEYELEVTSAIAMDDGS